MSAEKPVDKKPWVWNHCVIEYGSLSLWPRGLWWRREKRGMPDETNLDPAGDRGPNDALGFVSRQSLWLLSLVAGGVLRCVHLSLLCGDQDQSARLGLGFGSHGDHLQSVDSPAFDTWDLERGQYRDCGDSGCFCISNGTQMIG